MRMSVLEADAGCLNWALCRKETLRIFFEGAEVSGVVTADEERRLMVQLDLDEHGRPQINETGDGARMVTRYGHVRIEAESMHGPEIQWPR